MARGGASARLERLLSMVPWIAERDGPTIEEICATFDIDRESLLADLDVVFLVGLHPFTPDELVEVAVDSNRVWIRYAEYFARPLRLSPQQGLALVAAGAGMRSLVGVGEGGPLDRGLSKLAGALGVSEGEAVDIELDGSDPGTLETLRSATTDQVTVELDYYSYGRDERSTRNVDPAEVRFHDGHWYLLGWCHRSEADRVFRVDRIHGATATEQAVSPEHLERSRSGVGDFGADDGHPRAELTLAPAAHWVIDTYPHDSARAARDGTISVVLPVAGTAWLERLLLSLGDDVEVTSEEHQGLARSAAHRVLERYR